MSGSFLGVRKNNSVLTMTLALSLGSKRLSEGKINK